MLLWKLTLPITVYIELASAFNSSSSSCQNVSPLNDVVIELADLGVLRLVP